MKKHFAVLAWILAALLIVSVVSCGKEEEPMNETTKPEETTASVPEETTAAPEGRDNGAPPVISPAAKDRGSIKVLFVGNSFAVDVTRVLYGFLKEAGYEKVEIGVLFHGACTLEQHCNYFSKDAAEYTFYYNGKGTWSTSPEYTMDQVLKMTQWDHVVFNTGGGLYGKYEYVDPFLGRLVEHVREYQPDALLAWMSNWAWQEGIASLQERYKELYNGSQKQMYSEIVAMVQLLMKNHTEIDYCIPVMTTLQNMKTSRWKDSGIFIHRDGWHLSLDYGAYLSAMTVAKSISDFDVQASAYIPEAYKAKFQDPAVVAGLKAAVQDAFNDPWHVTENPYQ